MRRDGRDACAKVRMGGSVNWSVSDDRARRVFAEVIVAAPIPHRPNGPVGKTTAAIRTYVPQNSVDTGRAERALIGANPSIKRFRWQGLVAVFTVWSEFEHRESVCWIGEREMRRLHSTPRPNV